MRIGCQRREVQKKVRTQLIVRRQNREALRIPPKPHYHPVQPYNHKVRIKGIKQSETQRNGRVLGNRIRILIATTADKNIRTNCL